MYVIKNAPWNYFSYLKFRYEKKKYYFQYTAVSLQA